MYGCVMPLASVSHSFYIHVLLRLGFLDLEVKHSMYVSVIYYCVILTNQWPPHLKHSAYFKLVII